MDFTSDAIINRGQLLVSVTSHPGFHEIKQIIEEMCQSAAEALIKFDGWQPEAIQALQQRAKAAYEFRDGLYAAIQERIRMAEQQQQFVMQQTHFAKSESEKVLGSDEIREKALKLYDQMYPVREEDDGRLPGTYVTLPDGTRH
jgi:hypothetical protein